MLRRPLDGSAERLDVEDERFDLFLRENAFVAGHGGFEALYHLALRIDHRVAQIKFVGGLDGAIGELPVLSEQALPCGSRAAFLRTVG